MGSVMGLADPIVRPLRNCWLSAKGVAYTTSMIATACFCSKTRRASRVLMRLYDEALAPVGLTVTQFAVLRTIRRLDGPSLSALSEATGHERTAMWRTLQPMIRKGLAVAATGERGKAAPLRLTDAGAALLVQAEPLWEGVQSRIEAALGPHADALFQALDEVERLAA